MRTPVTTMVIGFLAATLVLGGCEGATGRSGPAGTNGSDGTDGTNGTQGPAGPIGPGGLPLVIQLPGDNYFPEGIALSDNGDFYIGSVVTGAIFKASLSNTRAQPFTNTSINGAAVGMVVDKGVNLLWVCQADATNFTTSALVGLDLGNGSKMANHDMPASTGGVFCNDVALDEVTGDLYASDSLAGRVVRVKASDRQSNTTAENWLEDSALAGPDAMEPFGANGIFKLGSFLYVVNLGRGTLVRIAINGDGTAGAITQVALTDSKSQPYTFNGADGMKSIGTDTLVVVENSGNRLTQVKLADIGGANPTGVVTVLTTRLDAPTTVAISFDPGNEAAFVVEGQLDHLFEPTVNGPPELPFGVVRVDLFLPQITPGS